MFTKTVFYCTLIFTVFNVFHYATGHISTGVVWHAIYGQMDQLSVKLWPLDVACAEKSQSKEKISKLYTSQLLAAFCNLTILSCNSLWCILPIKPRFYPTDFQVNRTSRNKHLHKCGPDDLVIMYSSLDSQDAKCIKPRVLYGGQLRSTDFWSPSYGL